MKKLPVLALLSFILILLPCCSAKTSLEGNWKAYSITTGEQMVPFLESNIKFVYNRNIITAKGCAGVNLYKADIKIKGKSFSASNMENSGFMGTVNEMAFEDKFFTVLMNADSYRIEGNDLIIFNSDKNLEMKLTKTE